MTIEPVFELRVRKVGLSTLKFPSTFIYFYLIVCMFQFSAPVGVIVFCNLVSRSRSIR